MTLQKSRSSPLDRSSWCASRKRFSLHRLVAMVLLFSPLASCGTKPAARDVRPQIASLSQIKYKESVIDRLSPGMIDARAMTDCQAPEACWALRKDATPAIFDGASQLQSVGSAAFLRAYLSSGTVIEPNYKSILAARLRYWLWAVDPRSFLFGYAVNGKVMLVQPKDFGAWPTGAELPEEIPGSGRFRIGQLFTVLRRSAMVLLFSSLGKEGLLQGVLGDSSALPAGAQLALPLAVRTPSSLVLRLAQAPAPYSSPLHLPRPRHPARLAGPAPSPPYPAPRRAAGGGYAWLTVSAYVRNTARVRVASEVPMRPRRALFGHQAASNPDPGRSFCCT